MVHLSVLIFLYYSSFNHTNIFIVPRVFEMTAIDYEIIHLQGDHVALLSAFSEMGLRLRLDMPEQVMEITSVFFRSSTPAAEAQVRIHYVPLKFSVNFSESI